LAQQPASATVIVDMAAPTASGILGPPGPQPECYPFDSFQHHVERRPRSSSCHGGADRDVISAFGLGGDVENHEGVVDPDILPRTKRRFGSRFPSSTSIRGKSGPCWSRVQVLNSTAPQVSFVARISPHPGMGGKPSCPCIPDCWCSTNGANNRPRAGALPCSRPGEIASQPSRPWLLRASRLPPS